MNRWSGFKAGQRLSIRAPLVILNLGKKQKLGVGGFSVPPSAGALLSPCEQGGPGAVGFSCSVTGRERLAASTLHQLRGGQGGHGLVLIGVNFERKCKTLRGIFHHSSWEQLLRLAWFCYRGVSDFPALLVLY